MKNPGDLGEMTTGGGDPPCICGGNTPLPHPWMGWGAPEHWGGGKPECTPPPAEPHSLRPVSAAATAAWPPGTIPEVTSLGVLPKMWFCSLKVLLTELLTPSQETREDLPLGLRFINMTSDHGTQHTFLTTSKNIRVQSDANVWRNHIPPSITSSPSGIW